MSNSASMLFQIVDYIIAEDMIKMPFLKGNGENLSLLKEIINSARVIISIARDKLSLKPVFVTPISGPS